jgi:hypothetical protein
METLRTAADKAWERQLVAAYAMFPAPISLLWLKGMSQLGYSPWWKSPNYLGVIGFVASSTVAFALYYRIRRTGRLPRQTLALVGAASGAIPGAVFFLASFGQGSYRFPSATIATTGLVLGILASQLVRHAFLHTMREHGSKGSPPNTSLERTH